MVVTTGVLDQPAVGQRQEVEAVVDDVELVGPLEHLGDVQALGDLGVDRRRPRTSRTAAVARELGRWSTESAVANSVTSWPRRHEALGEQRREQLPRPVVTGRGPPRDRGEHGDPQGDSSRCAKCRDSRPGIRGSIGERLRRTVTVSAPRHLLGRVAPLGLDGRHGSSPSAGSTPRPSRLKELVSRATPRRRCPPSAVGGAAARILRHPVDVPADGVRDRHVLRRAGGRAHRRSGAPVDVVRSAPARHGRTPWCWHRSTALADGLDAAVDVLNGTDVAIVQHEYGIYDGPDGDVVLEVLDAPGGARPSSWPTPCASDPRPHQRQRARTQSARAGRRRRRHDRDRPRPPGRRLRRRRRQGRASSPTVRRPRDRPRSPVPRRPTATRHGCSPGACSDRARASSGPSTPSASSATSTPDPHYVDRRRHPPEGPRATPGEAYREMLVDRACSSARGSAVVLRRHLPRPGSLTELIRSADLVVLPYDSADQVTSGVLVDAVAAGSSGRVHRLPPRRRAAGQRRRHRRAPA